MVLLPPGGDTNYFALYVWRPCCSRGSTDFPWRLWYSLLSNETRDKGVRAFFWWKTLCRPTCVFSLRRWHFGRWLGHADGAFINGIGALPYQKDPKKSSLILFPPHENTKVCPLEEGSYRLPTTLAPCSRTSGTVSYNLLVEKPSSLWYFVNSSLNGLRPSLIPFHISF